MDIYEFIIGLGYFEHSLVWLTLFLVPLITPVFLFALWGWLTWSVGAGRQQINETTLADRLVFGIFVTKLLGVLGGFVAVSAVICGWVHVGVLVQAAYLGDIKRVPNSAMPSLWMPSISVFMYVYVYWDVCRKRMRGRIREK